MIHHVRLTFLTCLLSLFIAGCGNTSSASSSSTKEELIDAAEANAEAPLAATAKEMDQAVSEAAAGITEVAPEAADKGITSPQ